MVLKQITENQVKFLGEAQVSSPQLEAGVYNLLYRFLASNPAFNPVDGTGTYYLRIQFRFRAMERLTTYTQ